MAYPNIYAAQTGPLLLSTLDANFLWAIDIQSQAIAVNAGGSSDAITATYSPAVTALVNGLILYVKASAANTTTTPQFSPNGLTALTIVKSTGALAVGDIAGAGHWLQLQYDSATTSWKLANPATVSGSQVTGTISTRINPRVASTTSATSITPDISLYDQYALTAQAATLTINAPTGTPVDGNKLIIRILDNGVARTLSWNATYTPIGVNLALPTVTTASKTLYVGCIYNASATRWDVVAINTQQ